MSRRVENNKCPHRGMEVKLPVLFRNCDRRAHREVSLPFSSNKHSQGENDLSNRGPFFLLFSGLECLYRRSVIYETDMYLYLQGVH